MSKITNGTPKFIAEVLLDPEAHGFPAVFEPDQAASIRLAQAYLDLLAENERLSDIIGFIHCTQEEEGLCDSDDALAKIYLLCEEAHPNG